MKSLLFLSILIFLTIVSAEQNRQQRSQCQEHRERELRNNRPSALIPECDYNGDYKDKQCQPASADRTKFCQCWAPNGDILSPLSKTTETCRCYSERHRALNPSGSGNSGSGNTGSGLGNVESLNSQRRFIPECENNGKFKKRQCHGNTGHCWCVDQLTGEQSEEQSCN